MWESPFRRTEERGIRVVGIPFPTDRRKGEPSRGNPPSVGPRERAAEWLESWTEEFPTNLTDRRAEHLDRWWEEGRPPGAVKGWMHDSCRQGP